MKGEQWDGKIFREGYGMDFPEKVASVATLQKEGPSHVKTQVLNSIGKGNGRC